ncbi:hypothetical protein K0M31_005661 [Melipona bicolor]|uniref:Uncharacterized protein n=1 Tax=Melipona bicolor TaxID=60889 RepID=A0AA40FTV8_9HYME|nr:hypothetical protein K0M31_005661 [Melipona bicolor]
MKCTEGVGARTRREEGLLVTSGIPGPVLSSSGFVAGPLREFRAISLADYEQKLTWDRVPMCIYQAEFGLVDFEY